MGRATRSSSSAHTRAILDFTFRFLRYHITKLDDFLLAAILLYYTQRQCQGRRRRFRHRLRQVPIDAIL